MKESTLKIISKLCLVLMTTGLLLAFVFGVFTVQVKKVDTLLDEFTEAITNIE